jgi:hypothetical protein
VEDREDIMDAIRALLGWEREEGGRFMENEPAPFRVLLIFLLGKQGVVVNNRPCYTSRVIRINFRLYLCLHGLLLTGLAALEPPPFASL